MKTFTHRFVDFMPEKLEEGVIYISLRFSLVSHRCGCGCGEEVVTPLSPTEWQLIFNGETVSLFPSIGNWNFACRSHYWIDQNRAVDIPLWRSGEEQPPAVVSKLAKRATLTDKLLERIKWLRWKE